MTKKKKLCVVLAVVLCAFLVIGAAGYYFIIAKKTENVIWNREAMVEHGDLNLTFMGEGTTTDSDTVQELQVDTSAVDLIVEEVYAAVGETVTEDTQLYKITEESLNTAISYYETLVADAKEDVEDAKESYNAGKAQADYDLEVTKSNAANAQEVYDTKNSSLEQKESEALAALEDAKAQISLYQSNIDNNYYYKSANVKEKKKAYNSAKQEEESAKKNYEKRKSEYESSFTSISTYITELNEVINAAGGAANAADAVMEKSSQLSIVNQSISEKKELLDESEKSYQKAREAMEKAQMEYQTAESTYERNLSDAKARKETLENSLSSLEMAYTSAQNETATGKIENKNTYDSAVLEGDYANTVYDSTLASYKEALEEAEEALEEAKEQQAALLELRDGKICAEYAGELSGVFYEVGDTITANMPLATYCDASVLTIETEVSQEDISKIAVGDTVTIMMTGMRREMPEGKISYIASAATSGRSMSKVTYTVKVSLDNTEGGYAANTSAYVIFSYGTLEDVDYISSEAIYNIDGSQGKVKKYNAAGELEEVIVTLGESTDEYTVITEGITKGDKCLIETGGEEENGAEK